MTHFGKCIDEKTPLLRSMDAVTVSGLRLLKAIGIGTDAKAGVLGGTCHVLGHGGPWWDMVGHGRTWWDMLGHGGTWQVPLIFNTPVRVTMVDGRREVHIVVTIELGVEY